MIVNSREYLLVQLNWVVDTLYKRIVEVNLGHVSGTLPQVWVQL